MSCLFGSCRDVKLIGDGRFYEYSTLLDIDYEALRHICDHLVYWRKARVINVVSLRNTYKPNPALQPKK